MNKLVIVQASETIDAKYDKIAQVRTVHLGNGLVQIVVMERA